MSQEGNMTEETNETVAGQPVEAPAGTGAGAGAETPEAVAAPTGADETGRGKRNEKIGIVASDKMQKTVVVRVDRLIKHPTYKRYVRRRSRFMAHNEIDGLSVGDQVRIVETRPLSARKRWRVVEVLRKASK
jgi:small subunit ribosomal protein S17